MAELVFHGICANCIHARTCRYSLNAGRPVHFCDHYEVSGKAPDDTPREAPRKPADVGARDDGLSSPAAVARRREGSGAGASPRFRGLCIDCVKRHNCEKAEAESGIWHCREYQGNPD